MKHYGVTVAEFQEAKDEADGSCPLCLEPEEPDSPTRKLALDHDHKTKVFRGLLCRNCNMAMGFIDDDWWLERALAWRERGRR